MSPQASDPNFRISFSWVEIRLHTEIQNPGLPGSGLSCVVVVGANQLLYHSHLGLRLSWAVTIQNDSGRIVLNLYAIGAP